MAPTTAMSRAEGRSRPRASARAQVQRRPQGFTIVAKETVMYRKLRLEQAMSRPVAAPIGQACAKNSRQDTRGMRRFSALIVHLRGLGGVR
jgi:hypothetical protein